MTPPHKLPLATGQRWQLLRAGIQNVWEYDDQRFVFHHGRLLLRGQNESGKTKALEVLLPFLLDASLQPQRLDPFGSNARAMRWNLLNESNPDVGVSIGYVWLEFGRLEEGEPTYWTVGAGLKARRSANSVEDWYFATAQRIDSDLFLLDQNRVPLTKAQLGEALGDRGQLFERGAEYRRALNERLFGLPGEQYSALVDALLQLRRPQLSKQLDPVELSRLLSASLPPLDAVVIGSLAEGFERLDRHRAEREEYQQALIAVRSFLDVYRRYVGAFLKARSLELTRAESAYHAARADRRDVQVQQDAAEAQLRELTETIDRLDREATELEERLRALRASDEFRAVEALDEAENQARRAQTLADKVKEALAKGRRRSERTRERWRLAEAEACRNAETLAREQEAALAAARDGVLEVAHGAVLAALDRGDPSTAADALKTALRLREETLQGLLVLARRVAEAEGVVDSAMARMAQAEDRLQLAGERLSEAESLERRAREQFLEDVRSWADSCRRLPVDQPTLLELLPEQMRRSLEPALARARGEVDEEIREASLAHDLSARELEDVRSEREALALARHRPPAAQHWRSLRPADRSGAPLYLLCEFREEIEHAGRAGLEAALEAAGLLDAWVMPGGEVLDADTFDAVILPSPRAMEGATLADVLVPVSGAAVSSEIVEQVLRSVGLTAAGEADAREAWVSTDGRFALGPLQGRNGKAEVAFIGAAAREQARVRRLSELDERIAELDATLAARARTLDEARGRRGALEEEVQRFPDLTPLRDRQATSRERGEEAARARAAHAEEKDRLRKAEDTRRAAVAARDARATEAGLRGWVDRLDELQNRTRQYGLSARTLITTDEQARRSALDAQARRREADEEDADLARIAADATDAEEQALRAHSRATALKEAVGSTRDELLAAVRSGQRRQEEVRQELTTARAGQSDSNQRVGALRSALSSAEEKVSACDGTRKEAEARLRDAARQGLFAIVGVELGAPSPEWSYTDALLAARKVDESTAKVDPSESARDKAWNAVSERHQELMRSLRPEIRVIPEQLAGLTLYRATFNARALTLLELQAELAADVATRDRLLGEEERKLFESFLTGEAHEHLRDQLRSASALVKRMNRQLQEHPTSSGMQMRLQWEVAEDAAAGTKEAVALLFKSGTLLSDSDRTALLGFLRQRLDEARTRAEARTLQEQLLSVLDYRAWHTFQVECRSGAEGWKRLTRKVHAAGSGGQKAVMLHLPLFAAAAAFYDSARPGSPRLILLDEAFAGIDRETRGQLMGLLSEFDLDFVMTSFEEWGFYPQLDGLSTYHLAREKGMRGVYTDWFVWNGQEAVQVHPA